MVILLIRDNGFSPSASVKFSEMAMGERERERCWVQLVIHPNPALVMADMQRKDSTTAVKHIALHFFPSFQCIFRFTPNWRHMDG